MNIRRTIVVGATLLLAALMAGCAVRAQGQPVARGHALAGTEWMLVSLNGNALVEDTVITLRFDDTSVEGSGGCNSYGGSYTTTEDSLSFSDVYRTEMACPEPEGLFEQEQAYFRALDVIAGYRLEGERLGLHDESGTQILTFVPLTADAPMAEETRTETAPEFSPGCTIDVDEAYVAGEPVPLVFELHNPTDRPLYVLTWYTPLEGMAGEIFQVMRGDAKLPYQGLLAKRGDPKRDEYIAVEPGETASAQVDLRAGYDLSEPGSYEVQFTAGLQDITDDDSLLPHERDAHQPQPLACNSVAFSIAPAPEPPVGFRRYIHGPSGVFLWVPESWTVIEPGPQGGPTILQSYPQDKYIGGEARQPGDAKCDLTVHPPGIGAAEVIQQLRSAPRTTIISEREVNLQSGGSGMRFEVESMGRALSLITTLQTTADNERTVVLTCFGELAPFDEMAVTLGMGDVR